MKAPFHRLYRFARGRPISAKRAERGMPTDCTLICRRVHRDLVHALEHARSRLAVAAAADTKLMTAERWREYLETEASLRRCIRELRLRQHTERHLPAAAASGLLHEIASTLRRETRRGDALELCRRLREILSSLAQIPGGP
jgi:hypothetical protein